MVSREQTGTGFERRRMATRSRIVHAANRLFSEAGYSETSMEDIAAGAGVGVRTIYLHFESKAAILLGFHDGWVEAFTDEICARPADEPIADTVATALRRLVEEGWPDPSFASMPQAHPVVDFIGDGRPEIAGHILQGWIRAQDRIAAAAVRSGLYPAGSPLPRVRAAAVFASWLTTILIVRDGFEDATLAPDATGNTLGAQIIGLLAPPAP